MADWYCDPINGDSSYTGDSPALTLNGSNARTYGVADPRMTVDTGGLTGMTGRHVRIAATLRKIVSVTSDTEVVLDSGISAGTNRNFWIGGPVDMPSSLSAGYVLAGDRVKFAKSPGPYAAGNFTYTLKSTAVTFAAGRVKVVDECEADWAGVANVTISHDTAAANRVAGSASMKAVFASAFTTGKAAYHDFGAGNELDLSAFQGLSCWLRVGNKDIAAGTLKLCLCSDAAGDVVVDEVELHDGYAVYGQSDYPVAMKTGGGNLGASIRSIALYCDSDPGTAAVLLDNIVAIKALSDADHICHRCLLSQDDKVGKVPLWGVYSFTDDTTLELTGEFYGGSEGAVATKRWECEVVPKSVRILPSVGTRMEPVLYSGGWDFVGGSQSGITALRAWRTSSSIAYSMVFVDAEVLEKFCFCSSVGTNSYPKDLSFIDCAWVGNGTAESGLYASYSSYTKGAVLERWLLRRCTFTGIRGWAVNMNPHGITDTYCNAVLSTCFEDVIAYSCQGISLTSPIHFRARNLNVSNCHQGSSSSSYGLYFPGAGIGPVDIYGLVCKDNASYGITFADAFGIARIWDLVTSGNATAAISVGTGIDLTLFNPSCSEEVVLANIGNVARVAQLKRDGDADTHVITTASGTIAADDTIRHTASGVAWRFNPTGDAFPILRLKLATIAVKVGVEATLGLYARRDHEEIIGRLIIPGGQLSGMPNDLISTIAGSPDMWKLLSLVFTPSETGTIDLYVEVWGGTTRSFWIDDLSLAVA